MQTEERAVFKWGCVSMGFIILLACLFTYLKRKRNAMLVSQSLPSGHPEQVGISTTCDSFICSRCNSIIVEVLVRMHLHPRRAFLSFLPNAFLARLLRWAQQVICYSQFFFVLVVG